jgi:uncharacterized protein involved in copper resistance
MIRLAIGLLPLMAAAGTVSAQDHSQHPSAQNAPQTPAATVSDPHAGHDMSAMTSQAADPHAGHDMSAAQRPAQTPAQTQTPAPTQADPHAGQRLIEQVGVPRHIDGQRGGVTRIVSGDRLHDQGAVGGAAGHRSDLVEARREGD